MADVPKLKSGFTIVNMQEEGIEEAEDDQDNCGVFSWQPKCLKSIGQKPAVFVVIYGLAGLVTVTTWSYFGSIITTLEKRFSVSSKTIASLMVISDISTLVFSTLVGYFGGNKHRPRLVGFATIFWGIGCVIIASPHFIYGQKLLNDVFEAVTDADQISYHGLCLGFSENHTTSDQNNIDCEVEQDISTSTTVSLSIVGLGIFLNNICATTYEVLGATYMDDNLPKKISSTYHGKYINMQVEFYSF